MGGSPVGYVREVTTRSAAAGRPAVRVETEMKLVLNRLGTKVELAALSTTEETARGILLRSVSELKASVLSTRSEALFRDGKIELKTESGGKAYSRTIDGGENILGPEGVRLLTLKALKKPGDAVEFRTFAAELEAVSRGTRKVLSREPLAIDGRTIEALKVEETIEAGGITGTLWLDAGGEAVKQVMPTPFGEGVVILSDRATALAAASGGALPPEMFERSILRSNVRLPRAREIDRLTVRLTARDPGWKWPEIKLPTETVRAAGDGTLEVSVLRPAPPGALTIPVPVTDANREYLEANAYVQSDQVELKALASEILGGEKTLFAAALKLRRYVADNMKFDLGIALAPSSEILRDRRGTCVGYATLLAALARAAGIPSRVVIGYVYAQGMFGGHAWTEVLADGRWIPIDAAIPSTGVADAARIGLSAASFRDGAGSLAAGPATKIFGQVSLRVLEFRLAGGPVVSVPQDQKPYRVAGDVYENPGLGMTFRKPAGFTLSKLDSVWPDPTLLALENADGTTAVLSEGSPRPWMSSAEFAAEVFAGAGIRSKPIAADRLGRPAFFARTPTMTGLVVYDGLQAWILTVKGIERLEGSRRARRRAGRSAIAHKLASGSGLPREGFSGTPVPPAREPARSPARSSQPAAGNPCPLASVCPSNPSPSRPQFILIGRSLRRGTTTRTLLPWFARAFFHSRSPSPIVRVAESRF